MLLSKVKHRFSIMKTLVAM